MTAPTGGPTPRPSGDPAPSPTPASRHFRRDSSPAPGDPRLAWQAPPLIAGFNAAGVIDSPDVHVATRLGRLTGEEDERVLLAVALTVRAVRTGSVCLVLAEAPALAPMDLAPRDLAPAPDEDVAPAALAAGAPRRDKSPELVEAASPGALPWPEPGAWEAAVAASPLVACGVDGPEDRPVRWVGGRLYLDRYWRDELLVRRAVEARLAPRTEAPGADGPGTFAGGASAHAPAGPVVIGAPADREAPSLGDGVDAGRLEAALARVFPRGGDERQREAAAAAVRSRLTILTGGPGTGKTTTVARLLAVLQDVAGPGLRVALAAPTGRAAARLQEAVREAVAGLGGADRVLVGEPPASTLHRLLGWRPGSSTRFRHDRHHRLAHDVVVVDETSMVSLPLMARLLEAVRPDARLILVGDPDQLASVEAGAVLGDLVARRPERGWAARPAASGRAEPAPSAAVAAPGEAARSVPGPHDGGALHGEAPGVVRLERVYRQDADSAILPLARAIRRGDPEETLAILRRGVGGVELVEPAGERVTEAEASGVRDDAARAGAAMVEAAMAGDAAGALRALEEHRVLLAHRRGPAGVAYWAERVERWVGAASAPASSGLAGAADGPWYPGRPLLITANDRDTGLHNGDAGVVVAVTRAEGGRLAVFGDPADPVRVRPHRLPPAETAHAMTVHRAQGSQFRRVSLILPFVAAGSRGDAATASPLLTRELLYTAVTRARERVRIVGTAEAVRAAVSRPIRRASGLREPLT